MHRAQIRLEPRQYEELSRFAQRAGKSVSHLVRQLVDFEIERQKRIETQRPDPVLEALKAAAKLRQQILNDNGGKLFEDDHIEEMREERAAELADALRLGRR